MVLSPCRIQPSPLRTQYNREKETEWVSFFQEASRIQWFAVEIFSFKRFKTSVSVKAEYYIEKADIIINNNGDDNLKEQINQIK